jgi:hypothetical protein
LATTSTWYQKKLLRGVCMHCMVFRLEINAL